MKRTLVALGAAAVVGVALAWSQSQPKASKADLDFTLEKRNPVTHLKLNNDPSEFQFAIVSDRTGGHRPKVFSRAIEQINLLQPEFVVSVGDLVEGYTSDKVRIAREWREFQTYASKLQTPFFYVPGNHDRTNKSEAAIWDARYGKRYYHFLYKNTLFLSLCSENPPDQMGAIDKDQQDWVAKTLEANKDVRWTFVFLHKPIWNAKDQEKNGWAAVEKALAGRKYNVFCGHVHRYQEFKRNGTHYYQLATTGGGSRMRGVEYGEFDMYMWVTMKQKAPVLAVAPLDGLLPANLKLPDTEEPGTVVKRYGDTVLTQTGDGAGIAYVVSDQTAFALRLTSDSFHGFKGDRWFFSHADFTDHSDEGVDCLAAISN